MTDKNLNKIKSFGFEIIEYCDHLDKNDTLFVTGCCAKKLDVPKAKVRDLYLSPRCQTFVKNISEYPHTGIISEKYGLEMSPIKIPMDLVVVRPKSLAIPLGT